VNDAIVAGMTLEPSGRPQTVRAWLKLLSNSPSSTISTKKFEFEYATLTVVGKDKTCKITRHSGQAEFFAENLGNGVVLEMVKIPGGKFMMGSQEFEDGEDESQRPQHQVTVPSFLIGKFAITQEQYQAVMGENYCGFSGAKRPVERVSWDDAVNFCAKISEKTGNNYRLPSETEWEYACRAGTTTPFHFGETITTDLVNYEGNYTYDSAPKGQYREQTTDVGSFPANQFGLYDMHGNVWEWCQDNWHENYNGAPSDGSAWLNNNENSFRLLRGGSWYDYPQGCRSAYRFRSHPNLVNGSIGFRVVCGGAART
jgi:formylglycine-generating enzyme required for sulfatase activity